MTKTMTPKEHTLSIYVDQAQELLEKVFAAQKASTGQKENEAYAICERLREVIAACSNVQEFFNWGMSWESKVNWAEVQLETAEDFVDKFYL